ncbi:hypothetical protein CHLRE_05g234660v5 [Chlamydomonas reinhardtii]|uniref:RING-CH-type domain-containing protein n=1 Tax=Chlamydomonas reinhardtii TaxID=3055 RepID=A0A2K3DSS5_CHLRE|nr:uncharacterized protein CHLRE_05g234660v5 [Chlamydomonas reinhardtii]PNW83548.1 hypothetical protein CHLRE_05g234660v5 [Chlamydomonas reinhardtii]
MLPDPEDDTCWICLEGINDSAAGGAAGGANNRLIQPCRCPRLVHSVCLAKWQLSQSGKSEEKFCRFCKDRLPDWQENLALPGMAAVEPVMSVHFNGQTHMVKVKPGEEGRVAFIQDVRRLLRLRDNQEFSITFECKVPGHGMFLDLKGLSSYDAAVFCAAMTAVERQRLAAQKAQKAAAAAAAAAAGSSTAAASTSVVQPAAAGSGARPSACAPAATSASTPAAAAAAHSASDAPSVPAAAPGARSAGQAASDLRPSVTGSEGAASDADVHHPASRAASSSSGASRQTLHQELLASGLSSGPHQAASSSAVAAGPTSASQVPLSLGSNGARSGAATAAVAGPSQPAATGGASGNAATGRNARWRSNTFDSACEVEPEGSAGGNSPTASAAVGGAAAGGAAATASAALGADRRKHAHRHQRNERSAQNASSVAAATGSPPAGAPSLLSRLFLCAGLGSTGVSRPVPLQ